MAQPPVPSFQNEMTNVFLILTTLAYLLSLGFYVHYLYSGREFTGRLGTLLLALGVAAHYFALLERYTECEKQ